MSKAGSASKVKINTFDDLFGGADTVAGNGEQVTEVALSDLYEYGYVKLQYYKEPYGFDDVFTYTDSRELFDDLWNEWFNGRLLEYARDTPMMEFDYPDIFKCLPKDKQKELIDRKIAFAEASEIIL